MECLQQKQTLSGPRQMPSSISALAHRFVLALAVLLGLAACRSDSDRSGQPDVYDVAATDADMLTAIASARRTVEGFAARVRAPTPTQAVATIKVRLQEGDAVEHIWLTNLSFDGQLFTGQLDNVPVALRGWSLGDTVRVPRDSISDWMLVDADTVFGAYSIHLLRSQMGAAERAAFDREQGLVYPPEARPVR